VTTAELTELLIERDMVGNTGKQLNPKISAFVDRLLLRIHSVPSLLSFLADAKAVADEENNAVKVQLNFLKLPDEFLPQLPKILAAPVEPKFYKFIEDGQARMGVELTVTPEDFPGDTYDYAM